jgi:protein-disulfide isomerase
MRDARTLSPVALVTILLFVVFAGSVIAFFPREGAVTAAAQVASYPPLTDAQRADIEKWWDVQPKTELPIPANGAKVLIVKFSDFMCPGCKSTHDLYKTLLAKYTATGDVRYIVKHYPLEPECNPGLNGNHFASCEAAAAEVMARPKGLDDEMTDWLFANQASLTPDVVKKGAREIAGIDNFDGQYAEALKEVTADATIGGKAAVRQTPTYFINGRRIEGGAPPQAIEAIIELELKRAAK